jgi:hypothetical protein
MFGMTEKQLAFKTTEAEVWQQNPEQQAFPFRARG